MKSTMESLYDGGLVGSEPQHMMTARRMQELGLLTALDSQTLTVEQPHTTIKAALSNADDHTNVQARQQHVHTASGYQHAADSILHFAQSQRQAPTQAEGHHERRIHS